MGFHRHTNGRKSQRNRSPSIQEHQCFELWTSEKSKNGRDTIHFNADSSNTELSFAQFTQQISSVSTEQSQAGVKSSVKRLRIRKSRLRERFVAKEK